MRRPWGLRLRVLAAAALVAVVSLITFGVLLDGLQSQNSTAVKARRANDAVTQAAVLDRIALELQASRDDPAALARARAQVAPAGRRLLELEPEADDRAQAQAVIDELTRYAAAPQGSPGAFRANLARFARSERAEQAQLRAEGTRLRHRATWIAVVGLVVLLVFISVLALWAVRAIVGPLGRLQSFARELGAGHFTTRLPETGPPETAELAQAFNTSAENLQRATERHLAELDAVFRDAPIGIAFLDLELRFVRVNEALAEMNQVPAHEHLGRTVGEVTGHHDIERGLQRVVQTGEPMLDVDIPLHGRRFEASYFAVRDDRGELLAVGKAMTDVTARRAAEEARERLQEATAALASTVTVADVGAAAVTQAQLSLDAGTAVLLTLDADRNALDIIAAHGLPEAARERWHALSLSEHTPATEAAHTGRPVYIASADALLERFPNLVDTPFPAAGAYASIPLVTYGRTVGVLALGFPHRLAFDEQLLKALAAQAAIALARAQLYEREHTVSRTLQASLLPRALPEVPGLDLAGRLEAGARGVEVGGDFYDAFAIADDAWGVAIGDVCGKGVDAAALTALARHTVRAAAHARSSPAAVLEALNRAVLDESRPGQFLTALFARVQARDDGGFAFTVACGGHPPPVVVDASGRPRDVPCAGTLLGVVADPQITESTLTLAPGDTVLLYTDGLTEAGAPERTLTTPEVAALLASVPRDSAARTAQACLARAIQASGGVTRDDIALLVVQVRQPALDRREKNAGGIFDTGTMP